MTKHSHSSADDMVTLFLTADEQKALSPDVRAKCNAQPETLTFQDSEERLASRMRLLHLEHPALKKLQATAQKKTFSPEEIATLAESIDLSGLSTEDLMELSFAWGPNVFTLMIANMLPLVKTDADIQALTSLADLRHGLLLAFNS